MSKPRDACGNDLIVPCTMVAMQVAEAAGLQDDKEFVKKLANGFYQKELRKAKE